MKISSDYYSPSQNSADSLFVNSRQASTESEIASSKVKKTTGKESKNDATLDRGQKYRETYGLDTLQKMTNEEYAAFERATANMSPNEKIQAAQSLHLVAKSFAEAQKMINGGGLASSVGAAEQNGGYFKNNPDMIDKGISVLKNMTNLNAKDMANFLSRYKGALIGGGLNLSA